jgi:hypothetical protein
MRLEEGHDGVDVAVDLVLVRAGREAIYVCGEE